MGGRGGGLTVKIRLVSVQLALDCQLELSLAMFGMKKCNKCPICPFVQVGQKVSASKTNFSIDINTEVNCQTKNIIYVIECKKCREQYVGESNRSLQHRFSEHLGYVRNKHVNKVTGEHFNLRGHSQSDMQISIIEKIYSNSDQFRKQRERMFI